MKLSALLLLPLLAGCTGAQTVADGVRDKGHTVLLKTAELSEQVVCSQSLPLSVYVERYVDTGRTEILTAWCGWSVVLVSKSFWLKASVLMQGENNGSDKKN